MEESRYRPKVMVVKSVTRARARALRARPSARVTLSELLPMPSSPKPWTVAASGPSSGSIKSSSAARRDLVAER